MNGRAPRRLRGRGVRQGETVKAHDERTDGRQDQAVRAFHLEFARAAPQRQHPADQHPGDGAPSANQKVIDLGSGRWANVSELTSDRVAQSTGSGTASTGTRAETAWHAAANRGTRRPAGAPRPCTAPSGTSDRRSGRPPSAPRIHAKGSVRVDPAQLLPAHLQRSQDPGRQHRRPRAPDGELEELHAAQAQIQIPGSIRRSWMCHRLPDPWSRPKSRPGLPSPPTRLAAFRGQVAIVAQTGCRRPRVRWPARRQTAISFNASNRAPAADLAFAPRHLGAPGARLLRA